MDHILSRFAGLVLAAAVVLAAPALAQTKPAKPLWAHHGSDIAPDPRVKFAQLPNGMRYALMKNQLPPGAVSIRLSVEIGSLEEADNEKGLAHFIEHMAFNGSKNVPEGEMVKILERLGLAFGADTNASTGQKFTTYQLDLRNAWDPLVDDSLFLMREVASELKCRATVWPAVTVKGRKPWRPGASKFTLSGVPAVSAVARSCDNVRLKLIVAAPCGPTITL